MKLSTTTAKIPRSAADTSRSLARRSGVSRSAFLKLLVLGYGEQLAKRGGLQGDQFGGPRTTAKIPSDAAGRASRLSERAKLSRPDFLGLLVHRYGEKLAEDLSMGAG